MWRSWSTSKPKKLADHAEPVAKKRKVPFPDLCQELTRGQVDRLVSNTYYTNEDGNCWTYQGNPMEAVMRVLQDERFDMVFGTVAWFTYQPALAELRRYRSCQFVVQKEEMLKLRSEKKTFVDPKSLRRSYDRLRCEVFSDDLEKVGLVAHRKGRLSPVMCMGYGDSQSHTGPRPNMHRKKLILGRCRSPGDGKTSVRSPPKRKNGLVEEDMSDSSETWFLEKFEPIAILSGSMNVTHNASKSIEDVDYEENPDKAMYFLYHYLEVLAHSESLEWTSDAPAPEFHWNRAHFEDDEE